ncbi:hypothetical protein KSP39_PZI001247 [Platanthera zijinensis]|uniref:Integrator complex subunit 4/Protein SIEL C-terminal Ig-like domain-containing protein n=1 Tax=Platanthera zijinensis TaxID=2320716 RepID=A0AAP0C5J5_9ASPA
MVDNDARHNLIFEGLVQQLFLSVPSPDVAVRLCNGHRRPTQVRCTAVSLSAGFCSVTADFYAFGVGGIDAILGVTWLRTLGDVHVNWATMTMEFLHGGQPCRLDDDPSLLHSSVSLHTRQRTMNVGFSVGLWPLLGPSDVPSPSPKYYPELSTALPDLGSFGLKERRQLAPHYLAELLDYRCHLQGDSGSLEVPVAGSNRPESKAMWLPHDHCCRHPSDHFLGDKAYLSTGHAHVDETTCKKKNSPHQRFGPSLYCIFSEIHGEALGGKKKARRPRIKARARDNSLVFGKGTFEMRSGCFKMCWKSLEMVGRPSWKDLHALSSGGGVDGELPRVHRARETRRVRMKYRLAACIEELNIISSDISGSGADFVAFAQEYVLAIKLVAEIWQHIHAKSFQVTVVASLDILIEKLEKSLRQIKYCFLGLSAEEESHILELILLGHVLQLHKAGISSHDILKKMQGTKSRLQLLHDERSNISDFIDELNKYSNEEELSESSRELPVDKLLKLFYLRPTLFHGKFRHIKADLKALYSNSENSLPFIPGLPVGIRFQFILYNIPQENQVWLRMAVGSSVQYIFIDLCNVGNCVDVRNCTLTLPFYATPTAVSFVLKACVCLELTVGGEVNLKRRERGPKHDSLQISEEVHVHFVGIQSY